MLKPLDQFYEGDSRFANIVESFDERTGILKLMSPQGLHEDVSGLVLGASVPENVRHQFDLALNAYLYSWFVYDFATLAETQGYAALEAALRLRYHDETGKPADKPSLKDLFEFVAARKWIDAAEFDVSANWHPQGKFSELDMMRMLRNRLAHGQFHLMPGGSLSALQTCHYIISRLYPVQDSKAA
jgi:hypothetical protein